jgi:parallel beta-helix repeat protein
MKRKLTVLWGLAVGIFLLVAAGIAQGRTIMVGQGGGYDFNTIQAAIDDANNGDTILVANGIYYGNGNRDIDFKGKAITIRSENGPAMCIINCQGSTGVPHRGFYFHRTEDANSVLDGLTIMNGYASSASHEQREWSGGGILCYQSSPTIRNCIIMGNTTRNGTGGGISASGRTVITGCIIKGNYAVGLGDMGPGGAGIRCGGSATVSNCIIFDNTAAFDGGGILCTFGNPTVKNCTITGNLASIGGGIGCEWGADALISNCTISGNLASSYGGGIHCLDSSPTLLNCILWGDSSNRGPEIASLGIYGTFAITISYCDVQSGQAGASVGGTSTLIWSDGNITDDPCFARPGYWDQNGTPQDANDDFWVDGDYHLKSQAGRWDANEGRWTKDEVTSPCIDAGDPASPIGYEPFPNGGIINMGAYGGTREASKSYFGKPVCETIVAGDINGDCIVNFKDFAFMAFHWLEEK